MRGEAAVEPQKAASICRHFSAQTSAQAVPCRHAEAESDNRGEKEGKKERIRMMGPVGLQGKQVGELLGDCHNRGGRTWEIGV